SHVNEGGSLAIVPSFDEYKRNFEAFTHCKFPATGRLDNISDDAKPSFPQRSWYVYLYNTGLKCLVSNDCGVKTGLTSSLPARPHCCRSSLAGKMSRCPVTRQWRTPSRHITSKRTIFRSILFLTQAVQAHSRVE